MALFTRTARSADGEPHPPPTTITNNEAALSLVVLPLSPPRPPPPWPHGRSASRRLPRLRREGFTRFGNPKSTIFNWLRNSGQGYKLGLFGKLMNGLNTGGGLGSTFTPTQWASFGAPVYLPNASLPPGPNNVPIVNTSHPLVGSAASPAAAFPVGYPNGGAPSGNPELDPASFNTGSMAQYFLPGFDVPGTAANPSANNYPGYQGISKDKWYAFQNLPGFTSWQVSNNGNYEVHGERNRRPLSLPAAANNHQRPPRPPPVE